MHRKSSVFLTLALASAIAFPVSAQSAPSAAQQFDKVTDVNAAVVAARAATKEKRYADAEALMLSVTSAKPELVIPWVELGLAQLGLKKYPESEDCFKRALGIDPRRWKRHIQRITTSCPPSPEPLLLKQRALPATL